MLQEGCLGIVLLQVLGSGDYGWLCMVVVIVVFICDVGVLDDLVVQLFYVEFVWVCYIIDFRWICEYYELDFVLCKLCYWCDGSGCLCQLYLYWMYYQFGCEVVSGYVLFFVIGVVDGGWGDMLDVICIVCGCGWCCIDCEYYVLWWEWILCLFVQVGVILGCSLWYWVLCLCLVL